MPVVTTSAPVLITEPQRTPWDLNFQVLGFPVRVHPFFWLIGLLLGIGLAQGENAGVNLLIWFVVLFGSILLHELGHALMIRRFGRDAYIVLHGLGGLAIEGRPRGEYEYGFEPYSSFRQARTPQQQILISAAGPGIQLLLALAIVVIVLATGGQLHVFWEGVVPIPIPVLGGELKGEANLANLVFLLLQVNIFWPIINLLPVLPLDGGQIAMQVMVQRDPWGGTQQALWLSVITGGAMAVFAFIAMQQLFTAMLFASLAVSSYMALQQMGGGRRPW
jgi:Zn-dependent protease